MTDQLAEWAIRFDRMLQHHCAPVYWMFNQGQTWKNRDGAVMTIANMDPVYRYVIAQHLLRRAHRYATRYSLGEAMAGKATVESIDSRQDAEGWIRSTPLYRALVANLPPKVSHYAKHHSTCTVRVHHDLGQVCTCHRAGCPFLTTAGPCTCREDGDG